MANHIPSHIPSARRTHLASSELKNYPLFSDNTRGSCGRPVRINIALFTAFAGLVDSSTSSGQTTIRQIENLRNIGGGNQGGLSNINCAFKHIHPVNGLNVFYSILDDSMLGKKTLFITDIRPNNGESVGAPGLYAYSGFSKIHKLNPNAELQEKTVYISGQVKNIDTAVEKGCDRTGIKAEDMAVFFSPQKVVNELGVWGRSNQSQITADAIAELSDVMNKNSKKRIYWVAEAEGAAILEKSLDGVSSTLGGFRMRVIDPLANTQALLQKLKLKAVKFGGGHADTPPIEYTGTSRSAQMLFSSNAEALVRELKNTRVMRDYREVHDGMVDALSGTANKGTFGKSKGALANHMPQAGLPRKLTGNKVAVNSSSLTFVSAIKRLA